MPTKASADVSNTESVMHTNEPQNAIHQIDLTLKLLNINFQLDIETIIDVFKKSVPFYSMDMSFPVSYFSQQKDVLSIKVCF